MDRYAERLDSAADEARRPNKSRWGAGKVIG
jgi:hypothetical protein